MKFICQNRELENSKNLLILLLIFLLAIHSTLILVNDTKSDSNKKSLIFPDQESALRYGVILMEVNFGFTIQKDQLKCELIRDFIWKISHEKSAKIIYFKSTDGELVCLDKN